MVGLSLTEIPWRSAKAIGIYDSGSESESSESEGGSGGIVGIKKRTVERFADDCTTFLSTSDSET